MRDPDRPRVEWMPGPAGYEALQIAKRTFPHLPTSALIDRLFMTGLHALTQPPWRPPEFWGRDRDQWQLPRTLKSLSEAALTASGRAPQA